MTVSDEHISAWLHGALTADEAARMAVLAANDPETAARAGRLRHLDDLLRQAVPLEDTLPAALQERLGLAVSATQLSNVIDLAAARTAAEAAAQKVRNGAAPAQPTRFMAFAAGGWRVAAQVIVVLGIGLAASQWIGAPRLQVPEANYRTLGDVPTSGVSANALVIFVGGTDASEARALASRAGARIVGAANGGGVWRLAINPARRDAALEQLRALPEVRMAEPIDGAGQ
jgi:hypothetical protein